MLWWRWGRDSGGEKTQRSGFCDVLGARGAKEERTWQCEEGAQRAIKDGERGRARGENGEH